MHRKENDIPNDVLEEELEHIRRRRNCVGSNNAGMSENSTVGLALSGGGIRSATFNLGVLEALKELDFLKDIDYLSTVSGGGYIGAWLSANCVRSQQINANFENLANKNHVEANVLDDECFDQSKGGLNIDEHAWVAPSADWDKSISHLRRYSNYLSPHLGFLSADSWSMFATWIRNTILVQLTVAFAIAALLIVPSFLFSLFQRWPEFENARWLSVVLFVTAVSSISGNQWRLTDSVGGYLMRAENWKIGPLGALVGLCATYGFISLSGFKPFTDFPVIWRLAVPTAILTVTTGFFLLPVCVTILRFAIQRIKKANPRWRGTELATGINYGQGWVQALIVIPMLITGFLMAAVLWGQTTGTTQITKIQALHSYSGFWGTMIDFWPFPLTVVATSLWLVTICSKHSAARLATSFLAPIPAVCVLYAILCGIMNLLHELAKPERLDLRPRGEWLAFSTAPALVLYAFAGAVVILIGMMGRGSNEGIREWWSRLGGWFAIYGLGWMAVTCAWVFGPFVFFTLMNSDLPSYGTALATWLGSTLVGALSGRASSTSDSNANKGKISIQMRLLNFFAIIGPYIFVIGLVILISTTLHVILANATDPNCCTVSKLLSNYWINLTNISQSSEILMFAFITITITFLLLVWRVDINIFSLNSFYRNRLCRCYLGASRYRANERHPQNFTEFDREDDLEMSALGISSTSLGSEKKSQDPSGPLHILNCALNLGGSGDLSVKTRHSASFSVTPYRIGSGYLSKITSGLYTPIGYRRLEDYFRDKNNCLTLSQIVAVSGAAASPNMGYHTSPAVAFLLTVFNFRLGWWFPNPRMKDIARPSPAFSFRYLVKELFGGADDKSNYLMISDGGHFENLGAYELIRRKCKLIIIGDAECDRSFQFEGLGSLIRMCDVDFDYKISINVESIIPNNLNSSKRSFAIGVVDYGFGSEPGVLLYIKAAMTGHEGTAIAQYKSSHPNFPHESTGNQFYGDDQFESYRRLGREAALSMFGDDVSGGLVTCARRLKP